MEVSVDKDYAITLDQITVYSDALSLKLDEVEELDSPYTLDVTSPGAERDFPKEDLRKVIGYYIGVKADNMKEKKCLELWKVTMERLWSLKLSSKEERKFIRFLIQTLKIVVSSSRPEP